MTHGTGIDSRTIGLDKLLTITPNNHQNALTAAAMRRFDNKRVMPINQITNALYLKLIVHRTVELRNSNTASDRGALGHEFVVRQGVVSALIVAPNKAGITLVHTENPQLAQTLWRDQ